jgi:tetratricopeptide (TPR) repeat protein
MHVDHTRAYTDSAYLDSVFPPGDWRDQAVWNWRVRGLRITASLEAGRARWAEVRSLLGEMDTLGDSLAPMPATALMGLLATLPLAEPVLIDLDSLRVELDRWIAHDTPTRGYAYISTTWDNRHQIRAYLLGLFGAIDGDYEAALEYADEVEKQVAPQFEPTISQDLAEGLRAEVYLRQGRPEAALAALERAPRHVHYSETRKSAFLEGGREAFLRGRVLHALERYDEALDVYAYSTETFALGPVLLAPSHYYRGEIYETRGDTIQAIWHYEAFAELWKDADPELQPKVREVLQHVAELRGKSST